jgi:hypothetical protein
VEQVNRWGAPVGSGPVGRAKGRNLSKRYIPHSEHEVGFAHYSGPLVCEDRNGRYRPSHAYVGGLCAFCPSREESDLTPQEPPTEKVAQEASPECPRKAPSVRQETFSWAE